MLKRCGWWWVVVVAYSILVSAQGPLVLGLGLKGFGLRVLGQGLTIVFWISWPLNTCQAQPAFEAYAFNLLSTYIDTVSVKEN